MEGGDDAEELRETYNLLQKLEQSMSAQEVKCFCEVDEGDVEGHLLLMAFLLKLVD